MPTEKRDRQRANRQARLEAALAAQARAKRKRQAVRIGVVAALVVAVLAAIALWPSGDDDQQVSTTDTSAGVSTTGSVTASSPVPAPTAPPGGGFAYGTGPCPPTGGVPEPVRTFSASPQLCIDPAKAYTAAITTSAGTVRARLDTQRTPGTTNNFVTLARYGYYDDTKLFRTDTSIGIIQGGGQSNTQNPGYLIPDEGGKFAYTPGDLVMARSGQPNSAGAQFFFAVNEKTSNLDSQGTYVTFGKVTEGLDVLQKILASHKAGPSDSNGEPDPPVTVQQIRIEES